MQKGKVKSKAIILSVIILLFAFVAGYIYIAKRSLPPSANGKSTSLFDITPLLIAKLQQMVLQGSDSLYKLDIEELQPSILSSQVQALRVSLVPDSTVLLRLDKARKAPDDVLFLSFDTLRITGINLTDFLHAKDIRLDTLFFSAPRIHIAHTDRPYNAAKRKKDSTATLYQKLSKQFNSLSIAAIVATNGDLVCSNLSQKDKNTELHSVSLQLSDIKIDSLTQYDTSRFLFSKAASFVCRNYISLSADSLYVFKVGSVSISAHQHQLSIKNLSLEPRGGKASFLKKLKTRNDMFTLHFPDIVMSDVDWWPLLNRQSLQANNIAISGGSISDYFDRSLPSSGKPSPKNNYPHQMLADLPFPVLINTVSVAGLSVSYEEFNPTVRQSGKVSFTGITGSIHHISNVPAQIKMEPQITSSFTARFMNAVPLSASFTFNLAAVRTGAFAASFHMGTVPNTLINPIAEPMGMYTLKSGTADEITASVAGDNYTANTNITMLYHDLRIFPLRKENEGGKMKKAELVGFLANTFAIKDANPTGNKEPRHLEVPVTRDKDGGSFFNFLWQCILSGIVKTIGLPKKFAEQ